LTHRWVKLVDEQIGFQIDRQEDSHTDCCTNKWMDRLTYSLIGKQVDGRLTCRWVKQTDKSGLVTQR